MPLSNQLSVGLMLLKMAVVIYYLFLLHTVTIDIAFVFNTQP